MKKRFLSLIMVLALVFAYSAAVPCSAAESTTIDGINYEYDTQTGTAAVIDCSDSLSGDVDIPKTISVDGTDYDVTSIGDRAFDFCDSLESVTIPSSVTSIGANAFRYCTGLTGVTIPSSVKSIGDSAFVSCTGITGVTIPSSVKSIGDRVFAGCTGLESVTIPSSVTFGGGAFRYCTGLTDVTIQEGVSSIGDQMFNGCTGLKSVTIPSSVKSIGNGAFANCTGITGIDIPSSVTTIGTSAFIDCTGLTDVTIQEGVTSIGNSAFRGCTGITGIDIPSSVTTIGNFAFWSCTGLTGVTIPSSVTTIGNFAFANCTGITGIDIPSSVTTIGTSAFIDCTGLTDVTIQEGVTSIGNSAFRGCTGLTDIFIPDGLDLRADQFYNINPNVWHYEVLEKADDSADGKIHVAITSVTDKNGENITLSDPVVFQDNAMGDIYVIDKVDIENVSLEHKLTKTGAKEPTCTEDGNIEYWTCEGCGRYFSDENGSNEITSESTILKATGHSYENGRCTVCSSIDPDFEPVIIDGANGEWTKGTKDGLTFTSNAAFADFQKVMVDGNDLDASDYTVKEGSTIVTLDADYLETLSEGEHEIAIVSDTGTAAAKFTVNAATAEDSDDTAKTEETSAAETPDDIAKTGDDFDIALFAIFAVLAAAGAVYTGKKKYNK